MNNQHAKADDRGFCTQDILWAVGIWSVILSLSPVDGALSGLRAAPSLGPQRAAPSCVSPKTRTGWRFMATNGARG
jgi:hypothetical protein